jgi:voltage-gated potassium channel
MREGTLRRRVYHALEVEEDDTGWERALNVALLVLIVVNVAAVVLETVPDLKARHERTFDVIEGFSVAVFTLEYVLRLWSSVEDARYRDAGGRLHFALSPLALIDLAAIAPSYVPGEIFLDLRFARLIRLVRLLRVLKIARYSATVRSFARVARAKGPDIGVILLLLGLMLLLASSAMYFLEHHAQPQVFSSIPASMWWAIVTLTTVGYGDVVPMTPVGRALGALIALIGIGFFALPAGLLAAAFTEEMARQRRREAGDVCPTCGRPLNTPPGTSPSRSRPADRPGMP